MRGLLTVCAVWVHWGTNTGLHVSPPAVRAFRVVVHSDAHITLVWLM